MAFQTQKYFYPYTESRVNKLLNLIFTAAQSGIPREYIVKVDDIEIVPRTSDPDPFLNFLDYLDDSSRLVVINLFKGRTRHYDSYILNLPRTLLNQANEELAGIEGLSPAKINSKIRSALDKERTKTRIESLEKENEELREANDKWVAEFNKTSTAHEALQKDHEVLKKKKLHDGDFGELAGFFIRGLLQRNPEVLKKLPGGDLLSGVLAPPTPETSQNSESKEDYDFQSLDSESENQVSEEPQNANQATINLTKEQEKKIEFILSQVLPDQNKLDDIVELLKPSTSHY